MDALTFNILLRKARCDSSALEELFNYYYKRIVAHLTPKYGFETARDAAQEYFEKLLSYEQKTWIVAPTAWVFECAENEAKKIISKDRKAQTADMPEKYEVSAEVVGDIAVSLSQLDEDSQKIIKLIYWDGYNANEVGVLLGLNSATVRQKHRRALIKLKNFYKDVTKQPVSDLYIIESFEGDTK